MAIIDPFVCAQDRLPFSILDRQIRRHAHPPPGCRGPFEQPVLAPGIKYRICLTGFFEAFQPELATVAQAAGAALWLRVVTTPR